MKGFARSVLLFVMFASMFYAGGILTLGLARVSALHLNFKFLDSPSLTLLRVGDVQNLDAVDVLFLGSSRVFMGFDTRIFNAHGYSAFNLGTVAQTPVQTAMLLDRYLDGIAPGLVVYEVYLEGFGNDGVESAIDMLGSDRIDMHAWQMVNTVRNPTAYHAFFFAWIEERSGRLLQFTDDSSGYLPMSGYIDREVKFNGTMGRTYPHRDVEVLGQQWQAFLHIVEKLKERNIPLLLVQAPVPSERYDAMTNRDSIHGLLRSQADFLDFNRILTLDDSLHFEDDSHLNQTGAEVFNLKLIELLAAGHPREARQQNSGQ
ncbi:MAG: DUF1574 domain-containing protein [Flavobacteriales bacterium]|nr:DUF1574 domain-containing protein [Flavobacteriales bacterium]